MWFLWGTERLFYPCGRRRFPRPLSCGRAPPSGVGLGKVGRSSLVLKFVRALVGLADKRRQKPALLAYCVAAEIALQYTVRLRGLRRQRGKQCK
jgi:hypothetical protein